MPVIPFFFYRLRTFECFDLGVFHTMWERSLASQCDERDRAAGSDPGHGQKRGWLDTCSHEISGPVWQDEVLLHVRL